MIETLAHEGTQIRGEGESLQVKQAPSDLDTFPRQAGGIAVKKTVYPSNWREMGNCTEPGTDPEQFFPVGTSGPALLQAEQAKELYCKDCPVAEACLKTALEQGADDGVWGGLSEQERRNMPKDERKRRLDHVIVLR